MTEYPLALRISPTKSASRPAPAVSKTRSDRRSRIAIPGHSLVERMVLLG